MGAKDLFRQLAVLVDQGRVEVVRRRVKLSFVDHLRDTRPPLSIPRDDRLLLLGRLGEEVLPISLVRPDDLLQFAADTRR